MIDFEKMMEKAEQRRKIEKDFYDLCKKSGVPFRMKLIIADSIKEEISEIEGRIDKAIEILEEKYRGQKNHSDPYFFGTGVLENLKICVMEDVLQKEFVEKMKKGIFAKINKKVGFWGNE